MRRFINFMAFMSVISVIIFGITAFNFNYEYEKNCEDFLKLAANSPNLEKADKFLGQALTWMEKEGFTHGNTSILWDTPSNNVGIWYEQIKDARLTIQKILKQKEGKYPLESQLVQDNALMKIRGVLLSKKGGIVAPKEIEWHPYRGIMTIWLYLSLVFIIIKLGTYIVKHW